MTAGKPLRSANWFATNDFRGFNHRSRFMQLGLSEDDLNGRPLIAVINTWSDINPCHGHFKERVESVKRGIIRAGGVPFELPAMSLFENLLKPSAMLMRNLLAMEVEEMLRAYPMDGVVLMGGCDKSTPGLLLGATSMGLPAIFVPAGPMLKGNWRGQSLGSGSDAFKYWDERRAGTITDADLRETTYGIARSFGTCMTMGTASTMTSIAEAIGMVLPGGSSIPAVDSNHARMAFASGSRIVAMVAEDLAPHKIQTRAAFLNGIVVAMALGCSTNAVIHLIAQARRAGVPIGLDDFDTASRRVPVLANVRPTGNSSFLMEDFYFAGGLPALMIQLRDHLDLSALTVTGRTLGENIAEARVYNEDVIRPLTNPVYREGALALLRGNLAPGGCVIKPASCDPRLRRHRGPALVFDDYATLKAEIDNDDLPVTAATVLVLRNAGPQGGPGMPEWGMIPLPKKLMRQGVRDMVRISDARMSGTSFGACILHVVPEAFVGGPLALVKTGDVIEINIDARSIHLEVDEEELAIRRAAWIKPVPRYERGYGWLFTQHISQASEGCDFDFLETGFGGPTPEPTI